jgi:5'-3' exonuclease
MGVPRFFSWVNNNYSVIIDPIIKPHEFYFDLNCLLHPKCFEIAGEVLKENPSYDLDKNKDKLEAKMFTKIIEYMEEILDFIQPTDLIYIAIDGVAPMAKMKHQRLRRFKSVKEQEIRNEILAAHKNPILQKWSNSVITPGTNFMKKLAIILLKFSKEYQPKYQQKNIDIILSTSNTHGEGEHKVHQYLKQQNIKNNQDHKTKIVYGLDADLLFLTMATQIPKLYVFREAVHIDEKSTKKFLMVDMDLLKSGIFEEIQSKTEKKLDINHVINDYIVMGFLLGNDFLPNIPSLTLSPIHYKIENGLDILLKVYPVFIKDNDYISTNSNNIIKFIGLLADLEESYFKTVYQRGRITQKTNESDPCKIALFQFDNLTLSDVNFLNIGKDDSKFYKKRYYDYFFPKMQINQICKEYLEGISWVKHYYLNDCADWLWLYKHHQSPFITDIYQYLLSNPVPEIKILDNKYSIKPLEQLMMVIPPEFANILPIECRSIFKNPNLKKYFPQDYDFDIFMKTKFWMAYPEIPNPNYTDFMREINKIKLSEDSEKLNKNFKPIEISD